MSSVVKSVTNAFVDDSDSDDVTFVEKKTVEKDVEFGSKKEMEHQGWHNQPVQILLDNGIWLTPTSDDEGNNGGAIHTNIKELPIIPVIY